MAIDPLEDDLDKDREENEGGLADGVPHSVERSLESTREVCEPIGRAGKSAREQIEQEDKRQPTGRTS